MIFLLTHSTRVPYRTIVVSFFKKLLFYVSLYWYDTGVRTLEDSTGTDIRIFIVIFFL